MEYEAKKKEILSGVQFTNLLSFSVVENKLERNFKSIVEALMLNQAKTDALNAAHLQTKVNHQNQIQQLNAMLHQINQKLQNLQKQQINTQNIPILQSLSKMPSQKEVKPLKSNKSLEKTNNLTNKHLQEAQKNRAILDQIYSKMNDWQNKWDDQKSQLMRQIQKMKDEFDGVGFLQEQLKKIKGEIRNVKNQMNNKAKNEPLKSLKNNHSTRNLVKCQSILNMISNKVTDKHIQQASKHSIINNSQDENKENNYTEAAQNNNQQGQQISFNQGVEKQINLLYLELNTLKISFEELKDLLSDSRKQIYKNNSLMSEIKDDLNREVKTRKKETDDLEKAIKDLKMQILEIENANINLKQAEENGLKESAKTSRAVKPDDEDVNYKNHLNDKISRMQTMLQNLVSSSEFNRLKNDLNDQIERLSAKIETVQQYLDIQSKKLQDLMAQYQANIDSDLSQFKKSMAQIDQTIKNQSNQNQRKNNIFNSKIQQLKKSLQNFREDIEFYQSLMTQNSKNTAKQQKKFQDRSNSENDKQTMNGGVDEKAFQALKKYFSGKMHDLRTNFLGLIRDLEKKLNGKSNGEQQIIKLWDRLNEISLFINKKADQDDAKKTFLYLEKKINRLNSAIFKNEDNTEDARIARTNQWNCLSCDKNLQAYQGKIGKYVVWDSMPLKGINKSFLNQMDDKKKGLPQLKK